MVDSHRELLAWLRAVGVIEIDARRWWVDDMRIHTTRACADDWASLYINEVGTAELDAELPFCDSCAYDLFDDRKIYQQVWSLRRFVDMLEALQTPDDDVLAGPAAHNAELVSEHARCVIDYIDAARAEDEYSSLLDPLSEHLDRLIAEFHRSRPYDRGQVRDALVRHAAVELTRDQLHRGVQSPGLESWFELLEAGVPADEAARCALDATGDEYARTAIEYLMGVYLANVADDEMVFFAVTSLRHIARSDLAREHEVFLRRSLGAQSNTVGIGAVPRVVFDWLNDRAQNAVFDLEELDVAYVDVDRDIYRAATQIWSEAGFQPSPLRDPSAALRAALLL